MFFKLDRRFDYYYTAYLLMTTLGTGYLFTTFSTMTVDMKYILNTSMSLISLYTTVETSGRLIGAAIPLLYKFLNRQLMVATAMVLATISCAVIPLVPNIWLLYTCALIAGISSSVVSSAYTVWLMEIWRGNPKSMNSILQMSEFVVGLGFILAPVVMRPYLVGEIADGAMQVSAEERKHRLMWPTLITGECMLPIGLSSFVLYCIKPYKSPTHEVDQNQSNASVKLFDRPDTPRKTIRLLCAFWLSSYLVFENMFLKFVVTYMQYSPQHLSAPKAAQIFSIAATLITVTGAVNVFVTMKIKAIHIIYYSNIILIVGTAMFIAAQYNLVLLWISNVMLCSGFASMYASIHAYIGELMTFTDSLSTLFIVIRSILTLVTPIPIGIYIEQYSFSFLIIESTFLIASILFFIAILYFVKKYRKKLNEII